MELLGSAWDNLKKDAYNYTHEAVDAVGKVNLSSAWDSLSNSAHNYTHEAVNAVGKVNLSSAWDSLSNDVHSITNETMNAVYNNGTYIWDRCDPSKMSYIIAPVGGFFGSVGEILKTVGVVVGWALLIFIVVSLLFQIVGFGCGGIGAGSIASFWQSCIGDVIAGSCFAILQGCGAGFCNVYAWLIILILFVIFSVISVIIICT